jgi:hypothetical protein
MDGNILPLVAFYRNASSRVHAMAAITVTVLFFAVRSYSGVTAMDRLITTVFPSPATPAIHCEY